MGVSIKAENLSIGYGKANNSIKVLEHINFQSNTNELIAVLGANGIGKSTFLKTIAGHIEPINGTVFYNQANIKKLSPLVRSQNSVYVPAGTPVYFNFNVFDYVALGRTPYLKRGAKLSVSDIKVIDEALHMVNAQSLQKKYIQSLSDGEKQKIFLAKALAQNTQLILLDEPTAFLDIENKIEIFYLLRELVNKEKKTILFSTHDWDMATQFADKLLIFGKTTYHFGNPEEMIAQKKLEEIFPSNLVYFDYNELHFKPNSSIPQQIEIKNLASEIKYRLTLNALRRLALNTHCNFLPHKTVIEVHENFWKLIYQEKSMEILSFDNLINAIKNIE
jgi:iron complex transport system ATP-binding protein